MVDDSCKLGCTLSMGKWPHILKLIKVQPRLALGIVSQDQKKENQNQEMDTTFSTQKENERRLLEAELL